MNKPDLGILLDQHKVVQFFADKVVLYLSYIISTFIIVDSFISLVPSGRGTVGCFIESKDVNSGQQSYVNEYCAQHVPKEAYAVPILIFCQGLITALLHYAWYAMVQFTNNVRLKRNAVEKTDEKLKNAYEDLESACKELAQVEPEVVSAKLESVSAKLESVSAKLESVSAKLESVSAKLESVRTKLNDVRTELTTCNGCGRWSAIKNCDNHCLLSFYYIKGFFQLFLAFFALVYAVDYEYCGNIPYLSSIRKNFNCSIINGDIDYWSELDTVQCFYNTIALNDIFVIFYIAILVCLIVSIAFGCCGICMRCDMHSSCCLPPTDIEIVSYTLDKKPPNNDTMITICGPDITYVRGMDFTLVKRT